MSFLGKIATRLDMMQEMFAQTGALQEFPGSATQVSSLRQAVQRCASCDNTEACRKFLDLGIAQELQDRRPPDFCPNSRAQLEMKHSR